MIIPLLPLDEVLDRKRSAGSVQIKISLKPLPVWHITVCAYYKFMRIFVLN